MATNLAAALAEAASLTPHLRVLNAGKGSQKQEDEGVSGFNKARAKVARKSAQGDPTPTPEQVSAAAQALHRWLSRGDTPLRAVLNLLGAHGCFYAASVNEKVARAWVSEKHASEEDAITAARARNSGAAPSGLAARAHDDEAAGLVAD